MLLSVIACKVHSRLPICQLQLSIFPFLKNNFTLVEGVGAADLQTAHPQSRCDTARHGTTSPYLQAAKENSLAP